MRLFHLFTSMLFISAVACGSSEEETYASFQECFDDHTGAEGLSAEQSIVVCALEHPELDTPSFATAAECVTFIDASLDAASASDAEIAAGCDDYIEQKDM